MKRYLFCHTAKGVFYFQLEIFDVSFDEKGTYAFDTKSIFSPTTAIRLEYEARLEALKHIRKVVENSDFISKAQESVQKLLIQLFSNIIGEKGIQIEFK